MDFLRKNLFAEKYEYDEREPELFLGPFGMTKTVSFDQNYMSQLFFILSVQFVSYVAAAVLIYLFIIKKRGSALSFLVGYGIVAPLLLYVPVFVIQTFDVRNAALLINAAASPAVAIPRLLQALYGTTPAFAEKNLGIFILHFAICLPFRHEKKTGNLVYATSQEILGRAIKLCLTFVAISILYSGLLPTNYAIFPSREIEKLSDLFFWGNLANNFLIGSLMTLAIDVSSATASLAVSLASGISIVDLNAYPIVGSTSFSEFWGQRWNRLVATGLKDGIYKPLRIAGLSKPASAITTFLASGILHEYMLLVLACRQGVANNPKHEPYRHQYGNQLIFFIFNAGLLLLEYEFSQHWAIQWIPRYLPKPLRTALVIMMVLPVGHLFMNEYINSGLLSDVAMFFPKIAYVGA